MARVALLVLMTVAVACGGVRADTVTLYSYIVDEPVDGAWNSPGRAEGTVQSTCSGGVACGQGSCSSNAPGGRSLLYLRARDFRLNATDEWFLTAGYAITAVRADIYGVFATGDLDSADASTSGGTRIEATNYTAPAWPPGGYSFAWTPTFSGSCKWQAGNQVLPPSAGGWTEAQVQNLVLSIRRASSSPSNVTAYVTSFRLEVDYLPLGRCCLLDGQCTFVLQSNCSANWTQGGTCSPNPCPQLGACCIGGQCFIALSTCGEWHAGTCSPFPCLGACCNLSTGSCVLSSQAACGSGYWDLVNRSCQPNPCPQVGACCLNGICALTFPAACAGSWSSAVCAASTCSLGACCSSPNICATTTQSACGNNTWNSGLACAPNPCLSPQSGRCCRTGTCTVTAPTGCSGGTWVAWKTCAIGCTDSPDASGGSVCCSCCSLSGLCTISRASECDGNWNPGACTTSTCTPPLGACCSGVSCLVTTLANCTGGSKRFVGANTACNSPDNYREPCCKSDADQSGTVVIDDLFLYFNAYFLGLPSADVNGGGVVIDDLFLFLNAWFVGGC